MMSRIPKEHDPGRSNMLTSAAAVAICTGRRDLAKVQAKQACAWQSDIAVPTAS